MILLHQAQQFALAHQGVGQAQPGKLALIGLAIETIDVVDQPLIQRTVVLELE